MQRIALLTAHTAPLDAALRRALDQLLAEEFEVMAAPLAEQGLQLESVPWAPAESEGTDWSRYAAVLVKSAWDYQDKADGFLSLLDTIAGQGAPVFNDPALVRWNIRKTYLDDFAARGVPVVPSLWAEQPTAADLRAAFEAFDTNEIVLKPQIGGGARGQTRHKRGEPVPDGVLLNRPGMIQPFIPAIATEGEFSFLFADNEFSHVLLKRPKSGDYRIQEIFGGTNHRHDPAPADLAAASAVLEALPESLGGPPLYARVDLVRGADGKLLLMELEVIEPSLFTAEGPQIGPMLAKALKRRIG
jgi:glutathione synthase/RimK-type ligase-like ATP-grasp enzyme